MLWSKFWLRGSILEEAEFSYEGSGFSIFIIVTKSA